MSIRQLTERYAHLRSELDRAYAEPFDAPGRASRIDRLAADIMSTELAIGARTGELEAGTLSSDRLAA